MMKKDDQFYIGWQDAAASNYTKGRKVFYWGAILALVLFSAGYLFVEKDFVSSYFDYGNLTELKGTVVDYPVFGLKTIIDDKQVTVPLVGFGKFDAGPVLEKLQSRLKGEELSKLTVTLRGTLIQYNGKSWMELTEGNESIVSVEESSVVTSQSITPLGSTTVIGEIVDPKCFFGVMNPAYGKIHKSCAIRCISGGIPPILAIKEGEKFVDYYFLIDEEGNKVNEQVLQHIGESVKVSGQTESVDDWKVMKLDIKRLSENILVNYDSKLAMCGNE
jgi:hypothetical protein